MGGARLSAVPRLEGPAHAEATAIGREVEAVDAPRDPRPQQQLAVEGLQLPEDLRRARKRLSLPPPTQLEALPPTRLGGRVKRLPRCVVVVLAPSSRRVALTMAQCLRPREAGHVS